MPAESAYFGHKLVSSYQLEKRLEEPNGQGRLTHLKISTTISELLVQRWQAYVEISPANALYPNLEGQIIDLWQMHSVR